MKKTLIGAWYNDLFGGVHTAGKLVLNLFGAGAIAKPIEQLESPYLPGWAGGTADVQTQGGQQITTSPQSGSVSHATTIHNPEFIIVVHPSKKQPDFITAVTFAVVVGGRYFEGTGYQSVVDLGKKFSFGFVGPLRLELKGKTGKKIAANDVYLVLFCGGKENV